MQPNHFKRVQRTDLHQNGYHCDMMSSRHLPACVQAGEDRLGAAGRSRLREGDQQVCYLQPEAGARIDSGPVQHPTPL